MNVTNSCQATGKAKQKPSSHHLFIMTFIMASGLIFWQQSADHSAGDQTQSWSWAPPCGSVGGCLGSTQWQMGRLPSDLQHLYLQQPLTFTHSWLLVALLLLFLRMSLTNSQEGAQLHRAYGLRSLGPRSFWEVKLRWRIGALEAWIRAVHVLHKTLRELQGKLR